MSVFQDPPSVPALNLKAQYQSIRDEIEPVVREVLENQAFVLGPEVARLEAEIADYCGAASGIGCASGSDAVLLPLLASDIGPGDEVITTPYTFFATAGSIWRTGARPVFVDIEPGTFNIDPALVEAAITPRTRAIIPVHLYGQTAEMQPLQEIARRRGIMVIEDAAQAIGAAYHGTRTGALGDAAAFSFYPSKNLGGFGDGGMVTTSDPQLAPDCPPAGARYGAEIPSSRGRLQLAARCAPGGRTAGQAASSRHLDEPAKGSGRPLPQPLRDAWPGRGGGLADRTSWQFSRLQPVRHPRSSDPARRPPGPPCHAEDRYGDLLSDPAPPPGLLRVPRSQGGRFPALRVGRGRPWPCRFIPSSPTRNSATRWARSGSSSTNSPTPRGSPTGRHDRPAREQAPRPETGKSVAAR